MNRKMPCLEMNKLRILRFMVPMHSKNERGLSMNRNAGLRHGLFSVPITSGAVPEAGAPHRPGSWSQCIRKKRKGALHEPTVRSPGFSRFGPPEGGTPNDHSVRPFGILPR